MKRLAYTVMIGATFAGLAACTSDKPFTLLGGDSDREYKPQASAPTDATPAGATAPAAPAPTVANLTVDPLNAPPPPSDGMLVPPPANDASTRVPLGTLAQNQAPPSAPTSLLTPPGQTKPAPAPQPAQTAATPPAAPPPQPAPQPAQIAQAQPTPPAPAPKPAPRVVEGPSEMANPFPQKQMFTPPAKSATADRPVLRLHMPDGSIAVVPKDEGETVVISSQTTSPQLQAREFIPASLTPAPVVKGPGPGDIPMSAAEKNTIQRFEILKRLQDEQLITQDEYAKRRAANAGALLPYTHEPGGYGLERPVPSGDAIVARLAALRRSFEMRAITAQQHALERTMILNALLPETPDERMDRKPPPKDMIEGAAEVGALENMREKNLITTEEMDAEKAAIEHAVQTGLLPSQEPARTARRTAAAAPKPVAATPVKATASEGSMMETPITGPVVHVGSYSSEAAAERAWNDVFIKDLSLLGSVKPIVRRVDLGDKGIFYRLMAGSYGSLSEAEAACAKLRTTNLFCRASQDGS